MTDCLCLIGPLQEERNPITSINLSFKAGHPAFSLWSSHDFDKLPEILKTDRNKVVTIIGGRWWLDWKTLSSLESVLLLELISNLVATHEALASGQVECEAHAIRTEKRCGVALPRCVEHLCP